MTREQLCMKIDEAIERFRFSGDVTSYERYGEGHINDTFLVKIQNDDLQKRYILQRINHDIFSNPEKLMENVLGVTSFLIENIKKEGGDPERETLNVILTKEGDSFYKDSIGSYWRAYLFIEDSICHELVKKPEDFYQSARAFGRFQYLLSDYDAHTLHETIPNFHNTSDRYIKFEEAIKNDLSGRADTIQDEIRFFRDRKDIMSISGDLLHKGELKLRVTHNDTKLNNIMMDKETGNPLAVIDLDTVMPGLAINDFGDSIRFGANTATEDETDLSKVSLDLNLFDVYTKGYIEGSRGSLSQKEIEMLPMGAKLMTLECGMRFLTDHLNGDEYFNIHRENHNLDRTRTQINLVLDMEKKWKEMSQIIKKYS